MQQATLAIDVGNSNIKWGLFIHGQLQQQFTSTTRAFQTADEYWLLYRGWQQGQTLPLPPRIVLSSVVPSVTVHLCQMCTQYLGREPLLVNTRVNCGLQLDTERPDELGSDLIANATAAYQQLQQNCIVIAFGTALTLVGVDRQARLRGVAITAGLDTTLQALVSKAALLSQIPLEQPAPVHLGRNTSEALRSGLIGGTLGAIHYLVDGIKKEIGLDSITIATGYHGKLFSSISPAIDLYDPQLTMKGLFHIANLQQSEGEGCSG